MTVSFSRKNHLHLVSYYFCPRTTY